MIGRETEETWQEVQSQDPGLTEWCILLGYRGSVAHGMYVPNNDPLSIDDVDLMGVCVPPVDYYCGLKQYGSRGTREIFHDPFDVVVYEARKYIALCAQGNPNVLSLLWLTEYHKVTPAGEQLLDHRQLFMGRHIHDSFVGYAQSQLQRMTHHRTQGYMGEKRKRLVEKFGYDTKNAAHLVRLLRMGTEALETGVLNVLRPDADELLGIKQGACSLEQVQALADSLFDRCRTARDNSALPDRPNPEIVNQLSCQVVTAAHAQR